MHHLAQMVDAMKAIKSWIIGAGRIAFVPLFLMVAVPLSVSDEKLFIRFMDWYFGKP